MNSLAGRSEAFQQICQRTFKVLFRNEPSALLPMDPAKREQNQ